MRFIRLWILLMIGVLCLGCDSSNPASGDEGSADIATPDIGAEPPALTWHEDCPIDEREQRLIDVGEVRLNVACRGAGPTIVFLHGFPEFHYAWNKVMDELVDSYRLVAPDQRGYNLSDKPEAVEDYVLPKLVDDILALLPIISPEPVILVAHDWGGPVGWLVAHTPGAHIRGFIATNGPHPQRFAELIANDPAQQEASSYMSFFRQPGSELLMTPDVLAGQFEGFLSDTEMEIFKEAWAQPGAIKAGLDWYRANLITIESTALLMESLSPMVTVPTVVMWGLDDEAVLAINAEGLDAYVADLEVQTFPGVDHWIEHRIPEAIADTVRALDLKITSGETTP